MHTSGIWCHHHRRQVKSAKLLGLTISDNLSWNAHVNEVVKKSSKKLYFLVQLKSAQLLFSDLVFFYKSCSRILSGASFLQRRAAILEKWARAYQKRALWIILPRTSYDTTCEFLGTMPLAVHHGLICSKLFNELVSEPNHIVKSLLPPSNDANYNLRNHRPFALPRLNTYKANNTLTISIARKSFPV